MIFAPRPRWVIHPVLLTTAYVLNTALANEVTPAGYVRALVIGALAAIAVTLGAWAALRNRWDGALVATVAIAFIVSPVSVAWVLYVTRGIFGPEIGTLLIAVLLIGSLGAATVRLLQVRRRRQPVPRPAAETLNVISIALLVAVICSHLVGNGVFADSTPISPPRGWQPPAEAPPEMVVILLDGYPRSDVLARRLRADNTSFLTALRQRGFDVGTTNHSNYTLTELTFSSMFQMRYVDEIASIQPYLGTGDQENAVMRAAIEAGQAFSILHAAGYQKIIWSAGWEHVTLRNAADRLIDTGELNELERDLLHRTWLFYLLDVIRPNLFTDSQRDRIVHALDALDTLATDSVSSPQFLFVHVPAPHLPLVIQSDGAPTELPVTRYDTATRDGYGMDDAEYDAAWQSEIDYLDRRTLRSVDALLGTEAGRRAVVIVMSDHGYGFELQPGDVQSRLGNLFAARTPGAPGLLAGSPTPVNLFRILFNRYLGTGFPLLPDRYFIHGNRQLDLSEILNPDQVPESGKQP